MEGSNPEAKSFIRRGEGGGKGEGGEGVLTESNEINNKNIFINAIGNTGNMRMGTRTSTGTSMTDKQKLLIAELERQDSQDDEEVLRAKAIALNAARLLNSSSQSMSNSTNAKPASLLLSSITNKKKKQPNPLTDKRVLLDPEQRKLIEEKLGRTLEDGDNDMIMEHHHMNNVGENVKREIREVALKAKEKWRNSFVAVTKHNPQQQQQQQQQQDSKEGPPAISGTTSSMSDSNLSINANESKVSAETNSSTIKPATGQISPATSKVAPQSKQLSQLPAKAPGSPNRPKQNTPDHNLRPKLTAVVWKRRSGFGKLTGRNAWEKRLIALIGNQLMYYEDFDFWDEVNKNGENSNYNISDNIDDEDANAHTNEEHNEQQAGISNNSPLPFRLGDSNSKQFNNSDKDITYPSTTIDNSSPSSRSLTSNTNDSDKPSSTNVSSSSDPADNKSNLPPSSLPSYTNVPSNNNRVQKKNDIRNLWEQASLHIVNAQENIAQSFQKLAPNNNNQFNSNSSIESSHTNARSASFTNSSSTTNMKSQREPRGTMDLIKESVTIAIPNNIYNSHVHVLCNQQKQNALASAQNNSNSATNNNVSVSKPLSSSDAPHPQSTNPLNNIGLQISAAASSLIQAPSPTPFVLSILSKNSETKWKFCFETQKDQMKWLWALSNVLIEGSVRDYNEGLLASNQANLGASGVGTDGIKIVAKSHGGVVNETTATGANVLSSGELTNSTADVTPSVGNVTDNITSDSNFISRGISLNSEGGNSIGRDQFWEVDDRCSLRNLEKAIDSEEKALEDDLSSPSECAEEENRIDNDLSVEMKGTINTNIAMGSGESYGKAILAELINRGAYSGPMWSLRGANLCFVTMVVNAAIFYSRASTTTVNGFWLALVLVNFIIYFTVSEDKDRTHVVKSRESNGVQRSRGLNSSNIHRSQKKVNAQSLSISSKGREQVGPNAQTVTTKSNFKPIAGETTIQVKNIKESPVINGKRLIGWIPLPSDQVKVRSHGYLKSKKKIASPSALYQVAKVDIFLSKMRVPDVATKVKLPEVSRWNITDGNTNKSVPKNWHSPDIFVVSVAVPTEAPKFGRNSDDGEGLTITIYYKMKEETRQTLQRITVPGYDPSTDTSEADVDIQKRLTNSVRLWEEWCKRAPIDPKFQGRFKFIPNVHNLKEIGLPSWMSSYCGKPVLIKRSGVTGFLYKHPELNAMEFDVSIHPFPYIAKQATAYLKEHMLKKMLASFGFVIEGRCDDELPEVVIGEAVQICYPDPAHIANADDFFAGTLLPSSSLDAMKENASIETPCVQDAA